MELRQIVTSVHGTYLLEVPPSPAGCLVGFHGYGENAERHLAELRRIPGAAGWALCAVQALHPFYNRQGEVIASWMTRFNREEAIADNIAFVGGVVAEVRRELLRRPAWSISASRRGRRWPTARPPRAGIPARA